MSSPKASLNARWRAQPSFLILGAMRAGTTSLYNYLVQHPWIARAAEKETHYFDVHYEKGQAWYLAHFPLKAYLGYKARRRGLPSDQQIITGEASPYYLFHPLAPERAAADFPETRLIVLLRDPVERAFSHYRYEVKKQREPLSFRDAINAEAQRLAVEPGAEARRRFSYVARGRYAEQLKRWLAHFPRRQLLVLQSEAFFGDPAETVAQVFEFLGLPAYQLEEYEHHNYGGGQRPEAGVQRELIETFAPYNEELFKLLGRRFDWQNQPQPAGVLTQ